mgnify:CR=1 FL=1
MLVAAIISVYYTGFTAHLYIYAISYIIRGSLSQIYIKGRSILYGCGCNMQNRSVYYTVRV